jgi:hypothetical protein
MPLEEPIDEPPLGRVKRNRKPSRKARDLMSGEAVTTVLDDAALEESQETGGE